MSDQKKRNPEDGGGSVDPEAASDESLQEVHASLMRKREEKSEGFPIMPIMIVFFFSALMLVGGIYMANFGGRFDPMVFDETKGPLAAPDEEDPEELDVVALGSRVYQQNCQACHQADGQGVPGAFPPLVETEWVTGSEERLVRVVLHGLQGPIEVRGEEYSGVMAPFGHLSDQNVAAVLTYIRQEWGNDASEVSEETVAEIRREVGSRGAWTAEELEPYTD